MRRQQLCGDHHNTASTPSTDTVGTPAPSDAGATSAAAGDTSHCLRPAGIPSTASVGQPRIDQTITPAGIAPSASFSDNISVSRKPLISHPDYPPPLIFEATKLAQTSQHFVELYTILEAPPVAGLTELGQWMAARQAEIRRVLPREQGAPPGGARTPVKRGPRSHMHVVLADMVQLHADKKLPASQAETWQLLHAMDLARQGNLNAALKVGTIRNALQPAWHDLTEDRVVQPIDVYTQRKIPVRKRGKRKARI